MVLMQVMGTYRYIQTSLVYLNRLGLCITVGFPHFFSCFVGTHNFYHGVITLANYVDRGIPQQTDAGVETISYMYL